MMTVRRLRVTLVRSLAKKTSRQRSCAYGLGLRRPGHSVVLDATPENLGMIRKIESLLDVEGESRATQ